LIEKDDAAAAIPRGAGLFCDPAEVVCDQPLGGDADLRARTEVRFEGERLDVRRERGADHLVDAAAAETVNPLIRISDEELCGRRKRAVDPPVDPRRVLHLVDEEVGELRRDLQARRAFEEREKLVEQHVVVEKTGDAHLGEERADDRLGEVEALG
jgi:hypothetical protein